MATKTKQKKKIICNGPVERNGAILYRLRDNLDIYPGQILEIGTDENMITQEEAEQLLSVSTWNFSEVTE
ncbi:hypothetical protein ACIGHG_23520 [Bacillus sp. NPDC077411]|uniref:hypothetical protein n=1 Tax=Bacillus sp. NPDC077411 TaxID=3363947 RepID=UPI0037C71123